MATGDKTFIEPYAGDSSVLGRLHKNPDGTYSVQFWLDSVDAGLALDASLPKLVGTWDYRAGAFGNPRAFAGRVVGIAAHSTAGGSMTINGGDSIPIPANVQVNFVPNAQLVSPALVFTGTDSYLVEFVS